jgi:hypothetical protein
MTLPLSVDFSQKFQIEAHTFQDRHSSRLPIPFHSIPFMLKAFAPHECNAVPFSRLAT